MDSSLSFSVSWPMPRRGADPFVDDDAMKAAGLRAEDMHEEEEAYFAQFE